MANSEVITIEVRDQVATTPADKLRDLAARATKADSAIERLKKNLNSMPSTSIGRIAAELNKIAKATASVTATQVKADAQTLKSQLLQQKLATEVARTATAEAQAALAKQRLEAATVKATAAVAKAAETDAQARERLLAVAKAGIAQAQATREQSQAAYDNARAVAAETSSVGRLTVATREQIQAAQTATKAARDRLNASKQAVSTDTATVAKINEMSVALDRMGKQAKLSRNQILTLQYTASDIVASLGSGISPMTIALQQGPQVAQAFTKELGGLFSRFGMVIGAAGTLAASVVALGFAYNSAANESAKLNNALNVTNNMAGLTEDGFKQMADQIAETANKSVSASREIAQSFVAGGQFSREEIERNSISVLRLAKLTDQSADDIAKSFGRMAESPTEFAEGLNKSYHFLSSAQLTAIRQLEETGQKSKAVEQVSKDLYTYLANVEDRSLGPLSRGWNTVSKAIANAAVNLKDFIYTSGPGSRIKELQTQLSSIAASQKINPNAPSDQYRIEALNKELGVLLSQAQAEKDKVEQQAENNKVQQAGYESSKRIADQWLKTVNNVNKANDEVAKFRTDIDNALKANPNDAGALAAKAQQAEIEKKIRESNNPDANKENTLNENRALAIQKINAQLDKQLSGLGKLRPEREIQQQMDQYELDLASRKMKLNEDERATIEKKLRAIQQHAAAQEATDRIYEESVAPMRDYNATLTASDALLKSGSISQQFYQEQINKAATAYQSAINPLKEYNVQLDQQEQLLSMARPEREKWQQLQQAENILRAQGKTLIDAQTGSLNAEGQALMNRLQTIQRATGVQQQYDAIYAQTAGAQQEVKDAIEATTMAYRNGLISAEQYGIRMNQLRVQAAQLRIEAGNAMPGDAALASFGRIIDGYKGMLAGLTDSFGNLFVSITDGFANAIAGAIMGTESLGDALRNVAQQAVQQLIASLIKLGIQYAINAAIGQSLGAAGVAASIAMGSATAVAWAPAAAAVSLATLGANAAPAAGAITSTNALSMAAALSGFREGGFTGRGGVNEVAGVVHGQEYVMPAAATARIGVENLNALRDGRASAMTGGGVMESRVGSSGGGSKVTLTVINNANNSEVKQEQREDANGNVDLIVTIDNIERSLAGRVNSGRGPLASSIGKTFGVSPIPSGG